MAGSTWGARGDDAVDVNGERIAVVQRIVAAGDDDLVGTGENYEWVEPPAARRAEVEPTAGAGGERVEGDGQGGRGELIEHGRVGGEDLGGVYGGRGGGEVEPSAGVGVEGVVVVGVAEVEEEPRVGAWVGKEGEADMAAPLMGDEGSSDEVWVGEVGEYGLENVGIQIRAAGNRNRNSFFFFFFFLDRCCWFHWYS